MGRDESPMSEQRRRSWNGASSLAGRVRVPFPVGMGSGGGVNGDQARLLALIYEPVADGGGWPVFAWVDHRADELGLGDAAGLLKAMPVLAGSGPDRYRHWWAEGSPAGFQPEDRVGLTVAGMQLVAAATGDVERFAVALRRLAEFDRTAPRSPDSAQPLEVTDEMMAGWLAEEGVQADRVEMVRLKTILDHEPPTWASAGSSGPAGWRLALTNKLPAYRDVDAVEDYLRRVAEVLPASVPRPPPSPAVPAAAPPDVFISHATADKITVARPLAEELGRRGYRVWLDETELKIGDHLLRSIEQALSTCQFGVVILSPSFFGRQWPRYELDGLMQRELAGPDPVVLPVWHEVTRDQVASYSPPLADKMASNTTAGIASVADDIAARLGPPRPGEPPDPPVPVTPPAAAVPPRTPNGLPMDLDAVLDGEIARDPTPSEMLPLRPPVRSGATSVGRRPTVLRRPRWRLVPLVVLRAVETSADAGTLVSRLRRWRRSRGKARRRLGDPQRSRRRPESDRRPRWDVG